ncbi:hypothetical protein [Spirosoma montaniterrae]|uniref:Uncharacterized protein n=1 Tax=Spirosoma montaniterrae TaxID=1178516 RepID=A0A1P9WRW4_9BACT|nr:hypothetical protein [Spirosoma montaniterrae]AQG78126.1 hypothetical protein AWR27_01415 [Spirosoma montaniterrae]
MKNFLIAFLLLFTVAACLPNRDKDDPEPELAGTYNLTSFRVNNQEFITANTGVTGTIVVTRPSDTRISLTLSLRGNGQTQTDNLGEIEIRKASGRNYDMYESGTRLGSINGTDLNFDISDGSDRIVVAARK